MFAISVTNEVPEHPVISKTSGNVFEKRAIEKYILENGCDPITKDEMTVADLIEIKSEFLEMDYNYKLTQFIILFYI